MLIFSDREVIAWSQSVDSRSSLLAKGKKDDCVVHLKGTSLFGEAWGRNALALTGQGRFLFCVWMASEHHPTCSGCAKLSWILSWETVEAAQYFIGPGPYREERAALLFPEPHFLSLFPFETKIIKLPAERLPCCSYKWEFQLLC